MHQIMNNEGYVNDLLRHSPSFKIVMGTDRTPDKENTISVCNCSYDMHGTQFKRRSDGSYKYGVKGLLHTPLQKIKTTVIPNSIDTMTQKMKKMTFVEEALLKGLPR